MRPAFGWTLLAVAGLAAILVPFAIWEGPVTRWTESFAADPGNRTTASLVLAGLLASDVLLPIPSSLVSTACGYLLGFLPGILASWTGMTLGAIVGYVVGSRPAAAVARRLVGETELTRAREAENRWGAWTLILSRSVPVLAEASVVFAGMTAMPFPRFLAITAGANLGVSAAYAWVGSQALQANAFLWSFAGAVALPGLAMLGTRLVGRAPGKSGKESPMPKLPIIRSATGSSTDFHDAGLIEFRFDPVRDVAVATLALGRSSLFEGVWIVEMHGILHFELDVNSLPGPEGRAEPPEVYDVYLSNEPELERWKSRLKVLDPSDGSPAVSYVVFASSVLCNWEDEAPKGLEVICRSLRVQPSR